MPLNLAQKTAIVEETHAALKNSSSVVLVDYRGITVDQMTSVRKQAREMGVTMRVVRNNLIRRAIEDTPHSCIEAALSGPTIIAFSQADPGAGARLLKNVQREMPALEVKGISLGGQLLEPQELDKVATLPTKEEAIAKLLSVMRAPVSKLAQVLNAVPAKLVRTLVAVKDQKTSPS